jgi:hypothetical protein
MLILCHMVGATLNTMPIRTFAGMDCIIGVYGDWTCSIEAAKVTEYVNWACIIPNTYYRDGPAFCSISG